MWLCVCVGGGARPPAPLNIFTLHSLLPSIHLLYISESESCSLIKTDWKDLLQQRIYFDFELFRCVLVALTGIARLIHVLRQGMSYYNISLDELTFD